ncbi:MAG: molybdenum cofactor guanylyltransferase [Spirochaetales bacterium]|nr:molybdenum cofactor guanylyltransferase [Spirochaetales bacterium]
MGQDKALLTWEGQSLLRRTHALLTELKLPVRISVRREQISAYAHEVGAELLVVDGNLPIRGPLRGILTAHALFPGLDLLVVACDMPRLSAAVLERLLAARDEVRAARKEKGDILPDFIAFEAEGIQPLAAIYFRTALARLRKEAEENRLTETCPRKILTSGRTLLLAPRGEETLAFLNANHPEDWEKIRAMPEGSL